MVRALRLEYSGALHHVIVRGNTRQPIVEEDADRLLFLNSLAEAVKCFNIFIDKNERNKTIVKAHLERGYSYSQIGAATGCISQRISKILKMLKDINSQFKT